MFSSGDNNEEFCFSGAGGSDGLSLAAIGDCATTQHKCIACGRTPVAQVVGMGGVQVTDKLNDRAQVQTIVNGMLLFMPTHPNTTRIPGNFTMLEDYVQSSEEICRLLVEHLVYADTLALEDLPLEVPLLFFGERMHTHPYHVTGSFEYVRKINDANAVVIPYTHDIGCVTDNRQTHSATRMCLTNTLRDAEPILDFEVILQFRSRLISLFL